MDNWIWVNHFGKASEGMTTKLLKMAAQEAMPSPQQQLHLLHAYVALVAAAPDNPAIAVPVEAVPKVETSAHVPRTVPIPEEIPYVAFVAI
ncbi:hypothetical protein OCO53_19765 [Peribacillus frigoritolerans]|uniref:hypothetical protein n=1 Tax=Peribacillus frigoritolerans TaxID=450367 RepID=UPI0021D39704|nr:hypothetical protein [Peribacillus frigoritolerans]MCU6602696.1 hypothetical protein [Peribacillus frigoritolerans]